MFTLLNYLDGINLWLGVLTDCLFFGSLYWGIWRIRKQKKNEIRKEF